MSGGRQPDLFEILPFDPAQVGEHLQLVAPPLRKPSDVFRQLRSVVEYAAELGALSIIHERHYIDRDHIEDHRAFYARSLYPYPNHCQRLHFFSIAADQLNASIARILADGVAKGSSHFREECKTFSKKSYLGFSVIRPLQGTPVGRTVLSHRDAPRFKTRIYSRRYVSHVAGLELEVYGCAFQQQDVGVSACATTAIWSALQQFHAHSETSTVTPADITSFAARHSLSGRLMPSEGLNLEQMCFALDALGVTPHLFSVEKKHLTARMILHAAIKSGTTPILLLQKQSSDGESAHAVTAVGANYATSQSLEPLRGRDGVPLGYDQSVDLQALIVHDDRLGPYVCAPLTAGPKLILPNPKQLQISDTWPLTHILVPTHPKVRLSLTDLQSIATRALTIVNATLDYKQNANHPLVAVESWFERPQTYLHTLFLGHSSRNAEDLLRIHSQLILPRYVGIVALASPELGILHLLVDMTSTLYNPHFLALIPVSESDHTNTIAESCSIEFRCRVFYISH